MKGKKKLTRFAPVTDRLEAALKNLWDSLEIQDKNEQIFPIKSFKTAWGKARAKAKIALKISALENIPIEQVFALEKEKFDELKKKHSDRAFNFDIRLRDLRRNFSTRLAKSGMENDLRQRILGHEMAKTTFDYTQADLQTALLAKKLLDGDSEIIIKSAAVN